VVRAVLSAGRREAALIATVVRWGRSRDYDKGLSFKVQEEDVIDFEEDDDPRYLTASSSNTSHF
jgi:hypothetical protein